MALCLMLAVMGPVGSHAHVTCASGSAPSVGVVAEPPAPREVVCTEPLDAGTRWFNIAWSADAHGSVFLELYDAGGGSIGEMWCSVQVAPEYQCGAWLPQGSSTRMGSAAGATAGLPGMSAHVPLASGGTAVFSVASNTVSLLGGPWVTARSGTFELSVD